MSTMTRRTALALSATSFTAALASCAVAPAYASELADVERKIEAHQSALRVSADLWDIHSDIEFANRVPLPRVQIGKMLHGRNEDGTDSFTPLYGYSEDEIRESNQRWRETSLMFAGRTDDLIAKFNARQDAILADKLATFRAEVAKADAANEASGLNAAHQRAAAASEVVDECLDALLDHPFRSLAELGRVAIHLIDCTERGEGGCSRETLARLLYSTVGREMPEWRNA